MTNIEIRVKRCMLGQFLAILRALPDSEYETQIDRMSGTIAILDRKIKILEEKYKPQLQFLKKQMQMQKKRLSLRRKSTKM